MLRDLAFRISRWLVSLILLGLAVWLVYTRVYLAYGPQFSDMDERLPLAFHPSPAVLWLWIFGGLLASGGVAYWLVRSRRGPARPDDDPDGDDPGEDHAALAAAWTAIGRLRRGHERLPVYLILGRDDAPPALLEAGAMGPVLPAPDAPGPLRGLRTADALFLQLGGAERSDVAARFVADGLARWPDAPPVRGVVVLLDAADLLVPDGRARAREAAGALDALAGAMATRCPVHAVVGGMERVPGFLEFVARGHDDDRTRRRLGFSLPAGEPWGRDAVTREVDRLRLWCDQAVLDRMERGILLQPGNEALFALGRWFGRARDPLVEVLDALATRDADGLAVASCFFAATGPTGAERAFAENLLHGKIVGDPASAWWSGRTRAADRVLLRAARWLLIGGGLALVAAWAGIARVLRPTGGWHLVAAGLVALTWLVLGWRWWGGPLRTRLRGRS